MWLILRVTPQLLASGNAAKVPVAVSPRIQSSHVSRTIQEALGRLPAAPGLNVLRIM